MAVIDELIKAEGNNGLSFGNYELNEKKKRSDFEFEGSVYKIKTWDEITRLERNEIVLFESVPGTAVHQLKLLDGGISFSVEGTTDTQITLGLADDTEYELLIDDADTGKIQTSMGGKLAFSVELKPGESKKIQVRKNS